MCLCITLDRLGGRIDSLLLVLVDRLGGRIDSLLLVLVVDRLLFDFAFDFLLLGLSFDRFCVTGAGAGVVLRILSESRSLLSLVLLPEPVSAIRKALLLRISTLFAFRLAFS